MKKRYTKYLPWILVLAALFLIVSPLSITPWVDTQITVPLACSGVNEGTKALVDKVTLNTGTATGMSCPRACANSGGYNSWSIESKTGTGTSCNVLVKCICNQQVGSAPCAEVQINWLKDNKCITPKTVASCTTGDPVFVACTSGAPIANGMCISSYTCRENTGCTETKCSDSGVKDKARAECINKGAYYLTWTGCDVAHQNSGKLSSTYGSCYYQCSQFRGVGHTCDNTIFKCEPELNCVSGKCVDPNAPTPNVDNSGTIEPAVSCSDGVCRNNCSENCAEVDCSSGECSNSCPANCLNSSGCDSNLDCKTGEYCAITGSCLKQVTCSSNDGCKVGEYCGLDNTCHISTPQKTTIPWDMVLIAGIALILLAFMNKTFNKRRQYQY